MKTEFNIHTKEIPQQDLVTINGGVLIYPEGRLTTLIIKILSFLEPTGIL